MEDPEGEKEEEEEDKEEEDVDDDDDDDEELRRAFDYHNIVTPRMPVTGK